MSLDFKRVSDSALEASGLILYADENWLELKVDLLEGASSEALYGALSKKNVNEGLDDQAIADIFETFSSGGEVFKHTIAKGKAPRQGKDGALEFLIEMEPNKVEVTDAEGNMDFRDLNLIKEIHSGSPIVKVVAPDEGSDGLTVQGKSINVSKGRKAKYRLGRNVRFDEETETIFATADGHVEVVDSLISVQEEFNVNKDVDFTIGNLNFIGSLSFEKSIPPGYLMEAGRDILVKETCKGSTLKAKGNISVEGGITGSENSTIECDGKLSAKYINEANVISKGDVECFYEVVRSTIKAMGSFILESGAVRGAQVYAFSGMRVKDLGSPMGTPTLAAVGVDFSVDEKVEKLQQAIAQLDGQKSKLKEAIAPFMKNKLLLMKAPESKKSAVKTILNKIDGMDAKAKKVEGMISDLEAKRFNKTKRVEINGGIEDDVTIQIGKKSKKMDKGKRKGAFLYDTDSFEIVFSRS
jgi:uncharacterized protein